VALSDDVRRIAEAAARYAAPEETVAAVIPVEPASGERFYLCAYGAPERVDGWLVLDDAGEPVTERQAIRDAASIAALVEVAEESVETEDAAQPRLASAAYLDSLGLGGNVAGALQSALPAIEELTRDVELNYKLELE
jgi:hypothetical protein